MADNKYLWRRISAKEKNNFDFQEGRPDYDDVREFAFGETLGIHMMGRDWMEMEDIFQTQKKYEKDFPEDFQMHTISRREVENTVLYMWLMGYVERKKA